MFPQRLSAVYEKIASHTVGIIKRFLKCSKLSRAVLTVCSQPFGALRYRFTLGLQLCYSVRAFSRAVSDILKVTFERSAHISLTAKLALYDLKLSILRADEGGKHGLL